MHDAEGLRVLPVTGLGEVEPGTDLADLIAAAIRASGPELHDGDVLVVTQKVVSKSEGRLVKIDHDDPAAKAALVERESVRVLRRRGELIISETRHGFVCANAGVDLSNVPEGTAALLPEDPDRSARRLRAALQRALGVAVGVVVSDTFGRAWRRGVTDVAIGCAGVAAVVDLKGTPDAGGRELVARRCRIGSANAAVLPVPVWAIPITSRPDMTVGIVCAWIGVGVWYFSSRARKRDALSSKSAKELLSLMFVSKVKKLLSICRTQTRRHARRTGRLMDAEDTPRDLGCQ